jgi:FKBP-type peptidyl-prolyl cis-trans isomerase FkpA
MLAHSRRMTVLCLALCLAPIAACSAAETPEATETMTAMTDEDKTFYALGLALAQNVAPLGLTADELAHVVQGLEDAVNGAELQADLAEYGPRIQQLAQSRVATAAAAEVEAGQGFLDEAAAIDGAERTDSGLVFTEVTAGSGDSPTAADTVRVHYHGTLRDGSVFDSSVDRGEPVEFTLGQVIPCWQEGLQKMQVGGKATLVCPPAIAYGDQGRPPAIPGGAVLVFDVELLGIPSAE